MEGSLAAVTAVVAACSACVYQAGDTSLSPDVHVAELKGHVYHLASPELMGRRGPGSARAARYVADAFERLGLGPAFGASYFQDIPSLLHEGTRQASVVGRNVAAVLPGSDPRLRDEWILLSAHFDHMGKHGDVYFPGADDNASGVAMLLEVAEHFALSKPRPRRTLVFVAFDQEEAGLLGSMYFAAHSPRPFRDLKAFLTADMLGRSMANVMDEYVFVLGSEHSPRLRKLLEEVQPPEGLKVGRLQADLIGTRSDYGPFRDRQVPFLFFSTGQHPDYHRTTDRPERIDYAKLRRNCLLIRDVTRRLADDDEAPAWDDKGLPPDLDEMRTVMVLVKRVLARPDLYPLTDRKRELVEGVEKRLLTILDRGRVQTDDRTWLMWSARLLLTTVF
jgi:hypothetical protein